MRLICLLRGHVRWQLDGRTDGLRYKSHPWIADHVQQYLAFTRSYLCWRCHDWIHVPKYAGRTYRVGWPYHPHSFIGEGEVELNDFGDEHGIFARALADSERPRST